MEAKDVKSALDLRLLQEAEAKRIRKNALRLSRSPREFQGASETTSATQAVVSQS